MSLELTMNEAIKAAMKSQDKVRLRGLRAIKAALLLANTDGSGEAMNEEKEIKLLQKLVKQRKDSYDIFMQQNRADLAQVELEEVQVIESFLPEQLSEDKIAEIVRTIIAEVGATSPKDMGKVIGAANKQLAGKAEGKVIAEVVKKLLNN